MQPIKRELRRTIAKGLCDGATIRTITRITELDRKTVVRQFRNFADATAEANTQLRDLAIEDIQADEVHGFVGRWRKEKGQQQTEEGEGKKDKLRKNLLSSTGITWTWLAIEPRSKLVLGHHIGGRGSEDANSFAQQIADRLARKPDGSFVVRPTVLTDGHAAYADAFERAMGSDRNQGKYVKLYKDRGKKNADKEPTETSKKGSYVVEVDRRVVIGNVPESRNHTAYIERENLNLRRQNSRYNRKTNGFSKSLHDHRRSLELWVWQRNYMRTTCPRRPERSGDPWIKRSTPAVELGLHDRPRTVDDLLDLTDDFLERRKLARCPKLEARRREELNALKVPADAPRPLTHWVFHSYTHRTAKVHKASCSNCRDGLGRTGSKPGSAKWWGFHSLDEAISAAQELAPYDYNKCNMCLGSYRTLGRRI